MTKSILLTAAALGVIAFAGTAAASDITAGNISAVPLVSGSTVAPYPVAIEANLPTSTGYVSTAGTSNLTVSLDSPVSVAEGSIVPFAVTYTLTGPGQFGAVAFSDLKAGSLSPTSGLAVVAGDKKSVTFYVEYTGAVGGSTISSLNLTNLALKVTAEQDVSIAADMKVTVAGFTQTVGTLAATKIVAFKTTLKPSTATSYAVTAALSDFKTFKMAGSSGAPGSAVPTAAISQPIALSVTPGNYANLAGGTSLDLSDILSGATATVTGPQVGVLNVTLAGNSADDETLTATSGEYVLDAADLEATDAEGSLIVEQVDPAVAIEAGTYKVDLVPVFNGGFSGSAAATLNLLTVNLDGTNFYAPWFALGNTGANSTLRIANNGTSAINTITISLKANNGTTAPTGVYTIPGIPAGQFVSVRGDQLKAAFGTNAANGDLQVNIQSAVTNVSAKVRTTQASGQIFENSLGNIPTDEVQ